MFCLSSIWPFDVLGEENPVKIHETARSLMLAQLASMEVEYRDRLKYVLPYLGRYSKQCWCQYTSLVEPVVVSFIEHRHKDRPWCVGFLIVVICITALSVNRYWLSFVIFIDVVDVVDVVEPARLVQKIIR